MAEKDLFKVRLNKLQRIKKDGIIPYFSKGKKSATNKQIKEKFKEFEGKKIDVCGRLISLRVHGRVCFADLLDFSGKIQLFFKYDILGKKNFKFLENLDIGDFIEAKGEIFKTKTGEITIKVEKYKLLTKSLLPLPEKWHGLSDIEERFRKRYLDLISNPEVKKRFKVRLKLISLLREFFQKEGFLDVETPILQSIPGGANAHPFSTYHRALDQTFYLRIAPELFLKKLLVGGFEKVYEIGRVFRNEGIDRTHNPEFTILEAYLAYADFKDGMALEEKLLDFLCQNIFGKNEIIFQNQKIKIKPPFSKITFREALKKYTNIDIEKIKEAKTLLKEAKKLKIKNLTVDASMTWSQLADEIFKEGAVPHFIEPTFVYKYPVSMVPLARPFDDNPFYVEKFQLYIGGLEISNNYSELTDPLLQRERFLAQMKEREGGNKEAQVLDEDFLEALSYGMPPACGLGFGIDRLVMLFCDTPSIKEVIFFPTLRFPKNPS